MMKIRNILTLLFLISLSVASIAQTELPLPPQSGTFTGATRGYWFTAPVDFTITEIGVPTDASTASQSVAILTLPAAPPNFAASTTNYTTEFLAQNVPGPDMISVSVDITAGTIVGILGTRGANSTNSYGQPNPFNTTLLGEPVSLSRFLMQADLQSVWPFPVSSESASANIGRVNITVADGAGPTGGCSTDQFCNMNDCITITCPPDATVACIDDVVIDANDAVVVSNCGAIAGQWVTNPCIVGAPNCPGTTYTYTYKATDGLGNVSCCERVITIDNTPPVITLPPDQEVECYEDIDVSVDDATVTNTCPSYNLYLAAPTVVGEIGCPGAQYLFTYRVIDGCGRTVEAVRTFTQADNSAPVITSVLPTVTCSCLAGINPSEDAITYDIACGEEGTVNITGPQMLGGTMDCPGTTYRYTYTVTDQCGRTSAPVFLDYVIDNEAPTFTGCQDTPLQFNCEDYGGEAGTIAVIEAYIASVEAYSACGEQLTVFNNFNSNNINTCINNGINTINFRTTDNCGRTSFCSTTYIVVDTEAPTIFEDAEDHWEICNYNTPDNFQDWVNNHGGAEAFDGCSTDNVFWSTTPANPTFNCMGAMGITSTTVTFNVRDNCGNTTSTSATFNAFMGGTDFAENDAEINQASENGNVTLFQNRPNPFKAETLISFNLPNAGEATITVYDINGRMLKVVQNNFSEGYNEVAIDQSELGATGVMYYRLTTDNAAITKTMLVIE